MRRALILAALLAGCDDESLPAKVANAQLHGIVAAQARCACELTPGNSVFISANKLIDGSCLTGGGSTVDMFIARSEALADICERPSGHLEGGEFVYHPSGHGTTTASFDITTCCTGFGFEAFGVE